MPASTYARFYDPKFFIISFINVYILINWNTSITLICNFKYSYAQKYYLDEGDILEFVNYLHFSEVILFKRSDIYLL